MPDSEGQGGGGERAGEGRSPDPGETYIFPRQQAEVNRLDLQHYALAEVVGANYLAPVHDPAGILDVGTGTGQWVIDCCRAFPHTLGVGLDLVAFTKPPRPPSNYSFVRGDVVVGLPFADGTFDFVHQRLLRPGVPASEWGQVIPELARVTSSGGWVELAEVAGAGVESAGPATTELFGQLTRLMQTRGLDHDGTATLRLDDGLRRAGLTNVEMHRFDVPIGQWGGRAGSFLASDTRAAFMRLAPVLEARLGIPTAHTHDLIGRTLSECEDHHTTLPFSYAWAQRPR